MWGGRPVGSKEPVYNTIAKCANEIPAATRVIRYHRSEADADAGTKSDLLFQRDVLLGEFDLNGTTLAIFLLHLKSQKSYTWMGLGKYSDDVIRAAEAREVKRIVKAYRQSNPGVPVIVMGDFNDPVSGASIAPLLKGLKFYDAVEQDLGGWAPVCRRFGIDSEFDALFTGIRNLCHELAI